MDAFLTISNLFTSPSNIDDDVSVPINEETKGSNGNAYCVVA